MRIKINVKFALLTIGIILLFIIIFCIRLWQPERQILKHQQHLFNAVESRDWKDATAFFADDYHDHWQQTKPMAISEARQAFRYFFVISIQASSVDCSADGDLGRFSARLKVLGSGAAISEYVKEHVNRLKQPFVFHWKRESWKPWDWKLTEIDQPELRIPQE